MTFDTSDQSSLRICPQISAESRAVPIGLESQPKAALWRFLSRTRCPASASFAPRSLKNLLRSPVLRSAQRGDLYVEIAVETPVKLSKRQKELLREFEGESKSGCQPEAARSTSWNRWKS